MSGAPTAAARSAATAGRSLVASLRLRDGPGRLLRLRAAVAGGRKTDPKPGSASVPPPPARSGAPGRAGTVRTRSPNHLTSSGSSHTSPSRQPPRRYPPSLVPTRQMVAHGPRNASPSPDGTAEGPSLLAQALGDPGKLGERRFQDLDDLLGDHPGRWEVLRCRQAADRTGGRATRYRAG